MKYLLENTHCDDNNSIEKMDSYSQELNGGTDENGTSQTVSRPITTDDEPDNNKHTIFSPKIKPLAHLVIVFSLYPSLARSILVQMATDLGATVDGQYNRNMMPLLICPEAKGDKYKAAIRFGLTVVNHKWLLECVNRKKRVPLRTFLVGDSILSIHHQFSRSVALPFAADTLGLEQSIAIDEQSDEVIENTPPEPPSAVHDSRMRIFGISNAFKTQYKKSLSGKIISLDGGMVCDDLAKWTHFICGKPHESEEFLKCVAGGKWVLASSYIDKSKEANRFLDEEQFEWGNSKAKSFLPTLDGGGGGVGDYDDDHDGAKCKTLAVAACRWRKKLSLSSSKGIFHDFRAILKTSKNEFFAKLIEAGGGEIIESENELSMDVLENATHVICQENYTKFTADEMKIIEQEPNLHCIRMQYLKYLIISSELTAPDISNFYFLQHDEVDRIRKLAEMKANRTLKLASKQIEETLITRKRTLSKMEDRIIPDAPAPDGPHFIDQFLEAKRRLKPALI